MPVPENVSDQTASKQTEWSAPDLSDFNPSEDRLQDLPADERNSIIGHFGWHPDKPKDEISYNELKLPHHRPSDGAVVFRGVVAAWAALEGARGGVELPSDEESAVRSHFEAHYRQFDETPPKQNNMSSETSSNEPKGYDLPYELSDKKVAEHKSIWFDEFEIGTKQKELESGKQVEVATFEGIANVMEHEDLGGDIIHEGAFKKTLEEKNGKVYFVTDHSYKIRDYGGIANLSEQGNKLTAKVEVLLEDNPSGQEFYTKAEHAASHGLPFGLSIGYDIPEGKAEMKDGVRHIYEVKLWEISGILFPMNELSRAVGFKDFHKYSRTDLVNAKQIIESLLSEEPSPDTPDDEADLLHKMTTKLEQLNKSKSNE